MVCLLLHLVTNKSTGTDCLSVRAERCLLDGSMMDASASMGEPRDGSMAEAAAGNGSGKGAVAMLPAFLSCNPV